MATNAARKARGRESEFIVAEWFRENGWPDATAVPSSLPGSDMRGMPGIDVEVKSRRGLDLNAVLRQLVERADLGVQLGVIRPDGYGPANIEYWPVVMTLGQVTALLRRAGLAVEE